MTAIDMPSVFKDRIDSLNPDFRFENFVAGENNGFVLWLTRMFAKDEQVYGKKIIIVAETGLGKTHLAQSFCFAMAEAGKKFIYIDGNAFSAKEKHIEELQQALLSCEAFVFDGIHFLKEDKKNQLFLLLILRKLSERKVKIVLTSSIFLEELNLLKELNSIVSSALKTEIHPPDPQTVSKIIIFYTEYLELLMPENVIAYLATIPIKDIRQLRGILENIKTRTNFCPSASIKKIVDEVLKLYFSQKGEITLEQILETVCVYFKADIQMIKSRSRKKAYSLPRRIYFHLCRQLTPQSLKSIGKLVGREHSTVIYGLDEIVSEIEKNPKLKRVIDFLGGRLKGEISSF